MAESLYQALGLTPSASDAELKKAYRQLARKHHPDVNPGDAAAEAAFKRVSAAWEVLGDSEKKKAYDEFGDISLRQGFDPQRARAQQAWQQQGRWGGGDPFDALYGRRRPQGPRKGRDQQSEITTDFRTAALGGVRTITYDNGDRFDVRIPAGVEHGGSIRLRGKGGRGIQGGPPGDLILTIRVAPHPVFRRSGLDLAFDLPLTVVEAIQGARIEVAVLEGAVTITVPPNSQTGQALRLKGRGVTRKGRPPGNLYAHLKVIVPTGELSDELLQEVADAYTDDVRPALRPVPQANPEDDEQEE